MDPTTGAIATRDQWDFPGDQVVKNLPRNAGDKGSICGWGIKTPHAKDQLSLHALGPMSHS